jgi:hypothetical protein
MEPDWERKQRTSSLIAQVLTTIVRLYLPGRQLSQCGRFSGRPLFHLRISDARDCALSMTLHPKRRFRRILHRSTTVGQTGKRSAFEVTKLLTNKTRDTNSSYLRPLQIKTLIGFVDGQTENPSLIAKNPEIQQFIAYGQRLTFEAHALCIGRLLNARLGRQLHHQRTLALERAASVRRHGLNN